MTFFSLPRLRWLATLCLLSSTLGASAAPAAPARGKPAKAAPAPAPVPVLRIGEINTYKKQPDFSLPYRQGWELALAQINADGGLLGQKVEILSRDDQGVVDDAVKAAQALVTQDKVTALFGGYSSEVGLGLAHYAVENKVFYLAVAPLTQRLTWQEGNAYTWRLRPAAWMQAAAVAPKALGQRKPRWALVYRDDESDRATADAFKSLMKTFQKVEFVYDKPQAKDKFDAEALVTAIAQTKPDAIFNMLTGEALRLFVGAGNAQQLFEQRPVVSLFTGDPENLQALGGLAPADWIVTGYPRDAVDTPANRDFVKAYIDKYGSPPQTASVLGYSALMSLAAGIKRAGSADAEKLTAAFAKLAVATPFGDIEYRAIDHQSTLGTWLGYTSRVDGVDGMDRYVYLGGARLQPLDEHIRRLRPDTGERWPRDTVEAASAAAAGATAASTTAAPTGINPSAGAASLPAPGNHLAPRRRLDTNNGTDGDHGEESDPPVTTPGDGSPASTAGSAATPIMKVAPAILVPPAGMNRTHAPQALPAWPGGLTDERSPLLPPVR
ncbi:MULTISPECIES: ABC transporter substrate-binding protein [unclassified Achromobacter]|uniref:ABC transporter substrate-binding protein n=1 Tax=unclassified Achromobacter TaxID=2626865 RepID=UPI000B51DEB2|nr:MULTISPECIES: ABC transporter substrate-binding protein [unclassified Achromobacter]OWT77416.1 ABC transporter substrate-binding protein [Achromobacter sp. HZ28]OWT78297.1 ABC transporter substrate-binding protein [Achromobacter sp. HZ34]